MITRLFQIHARSNVPAPRPASKSIPMVYAATMTGIAANQ